MIDIMNRREFIKKGGTGMLVLATSSLWFDLLFSGRIPEASAGFFEEHFGVSKEMMLKILDIALSKGGDFSEMFFEYKTTHNIQMEEEIIKETSEDISLGVGIRVISGEKTGYAYTNELSFEKMKKAALTAAAIANSAAKTPIANLEENFPGQQVYDVRKPIENVELTDKIQLVKDAYYAAQKFDSHITKVQSFLSDELQYVTIVNSEGLLISDVRPQVRLVVISLAEKNGVRNRGFHSGGGRVGMLYFEQTKTPKQIGEKASEEAIILLSAVDPPAGEQPVVLGVGQSGVMIHEAVGHPLEADGNRKGTSIMANRLGQKVATSVVTIYDDPTIPYARGSLNIDDEGTVTQKTTLIENGVLKGYLQDRLSARLMNMSLTGNGRRQGFQYMPIPRMTNTVLAQGEFDPEEVIASVKKGFYAQTYQGGQVQDTGKFVFSVNLGYLIENGKLTQPVKNATLIGTNVQILENISMVGNDMGFFLGTCGKDGQSVAVTAGTPTVKIEKMTVGGRK